MGKVSGLINVQNSTILKENDEFPNGFAVIWLRIPLQAAQGNGDASEARCERMENAFAERLHGVTIGACGEEGGQSEPFALATRSVKPRPFSKL